VTSFTYVLKIATKSQKTSYWRL